MKPLARRVAAAALFVPLLMLASAIPAAAWVTEGTKSCTSSQTSWALGDGTLWVYVWGPGKTGQTPKSTYSSGRHTVVAQGINGGGKWKVEITGAAYQGYAYCSNAN